MTSAGRLCNPTYLRDLHRLCELPLRWEALEGTRAVISGATGMFGTTLIDCLAAKRGRDGLDVTVCALGRSRGKARLRLPYGEEPWYEFFEADLSEPGVELPKARDGRRDLVFHLASPTHPRAYAEDPVGVVRGNVNGLENLFALLLADGPAKGDATSLVLASSVEIYGENRGDVERFDEGYLGYLDCATMRACYPEAKRLCESLCLAYQAQHGIRSVICRIPRSFGPTLQRSDTKALSQFIGNALRGEDIVLKSAGTQRYSYLYSLDCVSALLWCATSGRAGEAYNAASLGVEPTLRDLAEGLAAHAGTHVVFDLPDATEAAGFSTATLALLDPAKIEGEGWRARWSLDEALDSTLRILKGEWEGHPR